MTRCGCAACSEKHVLQLPLRPTPVLSGVRSHQASDDQGFCLRSSGEDRLTFCNGWVNVFLSRKGWVKGANASVCVGSALLGSVCVGSALLGSVCVGSALLGSVSV